MPGFNVNDYVGQLINFECYAGEISENTVQNRQRFLGIATVDLPEIAYQRQSVTGTGIAGVIDLPSLALTESMTVTLHWRSMTPEVSYLARQEQQDIALYGAVNKLSNSANWESSEQSVLPVRIEFRGIPKNTSVGKFAPNELMESTSEFEIIMLKVVVDGETKFGINKLNYIFRINGVDYAKALREALGL